MGRSRWEPPPLPFTRHTSGVSDTGLYASISRGDTVIVAPGVYIAAGAWPDDEVVQHQLFALARQMRWPHLVGSHETAALGEGLPLLRTSTAAAQPPRFTRAPGPGVRSSSNPRVTVRELPVDAVTEVATGVSQGLRLTSPARTAVDLALELELPEALMLTDHVARQAVEGIRGTAAGELSIVAQQAAMRPLELAVVAEVHRRHRVATVLAHTNPLRESAAESCSYGHFVVSGLPLPRCQARFALGSGAARVDFFWEDFMLVGECDGRVKYQDAAGPNHAVLVQQNLREQALRELGFSVVRWTAEEIMFRPQVVIQRIAERLMARGWRA